MYILWAMNFLVNVYLIQVHCIQYYLKSQQRLSLWKTINSHINSSTMRNFDSILLHIAKCFSSKKYSFKSAFCNGNDFNIPFQRLSIMISYDLGCTYLTVALRRVTREHRNPGRKRKQTQIYTGYIMKIEPFFKGFFFGIFPNSE